MYDAQAVQQLRELINKRSDDCLLELDSINIIDSYLEAVEEIQEENDRIKKDALKNELFTQFKLKLDETSQYGDYKPFADLDDPVLILIQTEIGGYRNLTDLYYAKPVCTRLKDNSFKLKLLIERTQKCLKDEKFKPDLKPIVLLTSKSQYGDKNYQTASVESLVAVIFIINQHSFIRLTISPDKVEERIQRAIRKDIIDIVLRDKDLEFVFHSIRDTIKLNLNSYKEARTLQEAIHEIRNSPMFVRDKR